MSHKLYLTGEEVGIMVALVGRLQPAYTDDHINALVYKCRAADIENRAILLKIVR